MIRRILDGTLLLALLSAGLFILGYAGESTYLHRYEVPVAQFVSPPHFLIARGFVYLFNDHIDYWILGAIAVVIVVSALRVLSLSCRRRCRRLVRRFGALSLWVLVGILVWGFGLILERVVARADSLAQEEILDPSMLSNIEIEIESDSTRIKGRLLAYANGTYAVCTQRERQVVLVNSSAVKRITCFPTVSFGLGDIIGEK